MTLGGEPAAPVVPATEVEAEFERHVEAVVLALLLGLAPAEIVYGVSGRLNQVDDLAAEVRLDNRAREYRRRLAESGTDVLQHHQVPDRRTSHTVVPHHRAPTETGSLAGSVPPRLRRAFRRAFRPSVQLHSKNAIV